MAKLSSFTATQSAPLDTTVFAVDVDNRFSEVGFAPLVESKSTPIILDINSQTRPVLYQDEKRFPTSLILDSSNNPIQGKWGWSARYKEPEKDEKKYEEFKHRISSHYVLTPRPALKETIPTGKYLMSLYLKCIHRELDQLINTGKTIYSPKHGRNYVLSFSGSYFEDEAAAHAQYTNLIKSDQTNGFAEHLDNIAFVSDTKAAAFHCIYKYRDKLKTGDNILVVHTGDLGVELAVYRVNSVDPNIEISHVAALGAGNCGSSAIDNAFIKRHLGTGNEDYRNTPGFMKTLESFRAAKESFGNGDNKEIFPVEVFRACGRKGIEWKLITRAEMELLFREATEPLTKDTDFLKMLRDVKNPISFAFLTGALGTTFHFKSQMNELIQETAIANIEVISAVQGKSAVCLGSLQYGLQSVRSQRMSGENYAVLIRQRRSEDKSPRTLEWISKKGDFFTDKNFIKRSFPLDISRSEIRHRNLKFTIVYSGGDPNKTPDHAVGERYKAECTPASFKYRLDKLLPYLGSPKPSWRPVMLRGKEKCMVDVDVVNGNLALNITHIKSQRSICLAVLKEQMWESTK